MDYNNMVSKEELVGQFALAGEKGASKEDVELIEAIAFMRNKAYEGGYRAAKKEVEEKAVAQIPQSEPFTQECAVKDVSFYECNGQRTVSSRDVAKNFEKEHKDVLRAIENITAQNCALTSMFFKTTYTAGTGKQYPMYLMNRDGFSLLAMGFTGAKAMEWKLKYIQAFNEMEKRLNQPMNLIDMLRKPESVTLMLTAIQEEQQKNKALEAENKKLKPASDYAHAVLMSKESMTTKQIAQNYGMSARQLNAILKGMKIQYKVNKQWILYSKYQGKGYVVGVPFDVGEGNTVESTRWTRKGQAFLYKKLKEAGYLPVNEQLQMVAE